MSERLEQLEKLYEADPTDPFLTYGIAIEHAKAEESDQAIRWLKKTLEIDPLYCYAFYQQAKIFSEQGDNAQARHVLEKGMVAAKQASDDHAHSEMAELLETLL